MAKGMTRKRKYIESNTKISKQEFMDAVRFVMNSTYFTFDNAIYKQIFGTPMGSPLSPILSDIVMQDLETKAFQNLNLYLPLYFRYVDDLLLLAPNNEVDNILKTFNSIHERLRFTIEMESNRTLNFLDLSLIIRGDRLIIDWYRKDTCSGRYLSYFSGHPLCHKIGTIYSLVDRAFLLSHPCFQQKNLSSLTMGIL